MSLPSMTFALGYRWLLTNKPQAVRGQSDLVAETANAKATAEVLEAKTRAAEMEVSRVGLTHVELASSSS